MTLRTRLARLNRRAFNPWIRPVAGRVGPLALVVHRGRVSGQRYRTPVLAFVSDDQVLIALVYSAETDWVRNVRAQGGCALTVHGQTVAVTAPELRPLAAASALPAPLWALLRGLGTRQVLVLHRRPA